MRLYAITDRSWAGRQSFHEQIETALRHGVTCLQFREKDLSPEDMLREAISIRELCKSYNVPFIVNDDARIAAACGADGVHIGQEDMSIEEARCIVGNNMIVGVTAHNVREAVDAQERGADYLGLGAVFATSTKSGTTPLSLDCLREICRKTSIPKVAIAGISAANILRLAGTGIDGVAVVSAIFASGDIATATATLRRLSEQMTSAPAEKETAALKIL